MKLLSIVLLFFISCKDKGYRFKKYHDVLYEGQCIAIPEYYRRIIGYDSVQFIDFMDKPEANFCYPNKWEFEKFKDTVFIHDTVVVQDVPIDYYTPDTIYLEQPLFIKVDKYKKKK